MIVHCPKCDEELELPEDAIGAKVQCCACEAKFFADETVVPDEFKAAALRIKAEGGDVAAQCTLGILYQSGQYVTPSSITRFNSQSCMYSDFFLDHSKQSLNRSGTIVETSPTSRVREITFCTLFSFATASTSLMM